MRRDALRDPRLRRSRLSPIVLSAVLAVALVSAAGAEAKPGLSLKRVELTTASAGPGAGFALSGKLRNRGEERTSTTVQAFIVSAGGSKGVGKRRLGVAPHSRRSFTLRAEVPAGTAAGLYDVLVCIPSRGRTACRRPSRQLSVEPAKAPGPPPTPGARSGGDPLFPEVGNGGFQVSHYDVELNWTLPDNFQAGTATTITATATQALSEFSLDLEGLTVTDVKVDGVTASSSREEPPVCSSASPGNCAPTKLVITPATPIDDGDTFTVEIAYTGDPQRHTDPDGSFEGWGDTVDGAFVVNEPIGAMTWIPCNNHPADRASFDYEITVPLGKTGIGNGELVEPPEDNVPAGTTRWHWASEATLPTYLSTATIGNFTLDQSTGSAGLPIYDLIDTTVLLAGQSSLAPEAGIIDFYSLLYGPYPFDSAGAVVDTAPEIGYALEVQTKPHFPVAAVDPVTLAHEIAHQWFGDSVTLTTWKDIWMNEGWATWSEWQWDFAENGGTSPADQFSANYTDGSKWNTAPANPTADGLFDTFPTYTRPGMMLEALHQILGDQKFFQLARTWQSDHRHGNATRAQFIALAKQVSGFSGANLAKLDTFFSQWLDGTGSTKPSINGANFFDP